MAVSKGKMAAKGQAGKGTATEGKKGFGFIEVPKDLGGGDLMVMEGTGSATLTKIHFGVSQAQKPKATLEFTLTSELDGYDESMGAKVLENCSLQPQALWKLNDYYKQVEGEDIPAGNYSQEEFEELIKEKLIGTEWNLSLVIGNDDKGNGRTEIAKAILA